ncbi:sugar ABC transporter substrate-binding protein [Demequina sp. NBRC 110056]|uniref:ABC transporter substrate-binding protein n=1 Tax=Demequina sp. NBRC 110056 TaxID=1570345 RepID=UPI000A00030E|nr:sugar ABC transporter substrate-binding protein [Demequina sp. NBRC 110056]
MKRITRMAIPAGIAATALALSACSSGDDGGSSDGSEGGGTVTLWARDSQSDFMQELADGFNASHETQVEVTIVTSAEYVQKFGTAAAGGDAPDLASIDLVYVPYFASVGALTDISEQVAGLDWADDMSPAHTSQGEYEGGVYSMPFTADVSVLFYNKDLMAEAGLDPEDPPSSMAELQAAAEAVAAIDDETFGTAFSGACGGCQLFGLAPHVWASGGNMLSDDGTQAQFDSAEVTAMLELYRGLYEAGTMPELVTTDSGSNAGDAFAQGRVGFYQWGSFYVGNLAEADFEWGIVPISGTDDGQSAAFAGGDNITIPSGASNPEGAWEFLEWASGDEGQQVLVDRGQLPIRMDLIDEIYTPLDERNAVFADALATGNVPYSVVENELFNDSNGVWATLLQEAVFGSGSVADAQAKAQAAAQELIDSAQ